MQILLRNVKSGQFYRSENAWTDLPEKALCFHHCGECVRLVYEQKLQDVEILLAFEDPRYNFSLPVRPPSSL
jgi:hypothetical protein